MKRHGIIGLVCLLLAWPLLAQEPTPSPTFPIVVGTPVEWNIDDNNPAERYSFEGNAGSDALLLMETTFGDLDPLLVLLGPDGTELARNNAGPGTPDAAISIVLPLDGTYTVIATRAGEETGPTSGTYVLLLEIEGETLPSGELDPLTQPPSFSVPFERLNLQEFASGSLSALQPRLYYAVAGEQSDLLRAILTVTEGELAAQVQVLDETLTAIGDTVRPRDEVIAFGTLPRRDWYLIEVSHQSGEGGFSLYADTLVGQSLAYDNETITGVFDVNTPTVPFTFEGTIGDTIFASAVVTEGNASPQVRLLDISRETVASADGARFASLQTTLPRSGIYILEVAPTGEDATGEFNLRFNALQTNPANLPTLAAEYNSSYTGEITPTNTQVYYAFPGRQGDIISATLEGINDELDPLLILMDEELNELVVNDNTRGNRNAQISQFPLPADGTYYLLATRAESEGDSISGPYNLTLTVGAVVLNSGSVTAELRWSSDDDLNLFLREPSGRVISWSNPDTLDDSGTLQIDSNTNCTTRSADPVEYIYWEPGDFPADGDYEIWVWYQQACGQANPVTFSFKLMNNGVDVLDLETITLNEGERYNIDVRVRQPDVFVLDAGNITQPSAQQRASEGGDTPLLLGQTVTGSVSDDVYARFYQFDGNEGQTVTLQASAITGDLDPVLVLRNNEETNLVEADDISAENRDAAITHELPYTGRYVVAVTRFGVRDGLTVGDYRLSLRASGRSDGDEDDEGDPP